MVNHLMLLKPAIFFIMAQRLSGRREHRQRMNRCEGCGLSTIDVAVPLSPFLTKTFSAGRMPA
jgi:hypothetical protein